MISMTARSSTRRLSAVTAAWNASLLWITKLPPPASQFCILHSCILPFQSCGLTSRRVNAKLCQYGTPALEKAMVGWVMLSVRNIPVTSVSPSSGR